MSLSHWGTDWPLIAELDIVTAAGGIAVIHDFDIGHDRFSYDSYDGIPRGPLVLSRMGSQPSWYYALDPSAALPVPCLQTGRRAGVGVVLGRDLPAGQEPPSRFLAARPLGGGRAMTEETRVPVLGDLRGMPFLDDEFASRRLLAVIAVDTYARTFTHLRLSALTSQDSARKLRQMAEVKRQLAPPRSESKDPPPARGGSWLDVCIS